jgi:hypothetical protein
MNAATRVCGQLVHTIMNALLLKARPPSSAAALPSRSRRRKRYEPPTATRISSSLTNAGAIDAGNT